MLKKIEIDRLLSDKPLQFRNPREGLRKLVGRSAGKGKGTFDGPCTMVTSNLRLEKTGSCGNSQQFQSIFGGSDAIVTAKCRLDTFSLNPASKG
ncbi:hypothetical protein NKH75_30825 [Mesorhizobium sp. M0984]|uniref:hypothetical protein n=1 Tax=Mesorhizobium sp. M0984 TaxID=2957041 RepID=UPI00333C25AA